MCGICCLVSFAGSSIDRSCLQDDENLRNRGPSSSQQLNRNNPSHGYNCYFSGHVLHLRGPLTPQPLKDKNGNVFLWNGELFGGIEVPYAENDTQIMFQHLSKCDDESKIMSLFAKVKGPWAFIYYQANYHQLWFGRDFFGRRSLLWKFTDDLNKVFSLSSVSECRSESDSDDWQEVPASGLFRCDLQSSAKLKYIELTWYPWKTASDILPTKESQILKSSSLVSIVLGKSKWLTAPVSPLNKQIPEEFKKSHNISSQNKTAVEHLRMLATDQHKKNAQSLIKILSEAVKRRVLCLQRECNLMSNSEKNANVAILFSGGIDSMILAVLADHHVPPEEPIDLLNVAFMMKEQKSSGLKKHLPKCTLQIANPDRPTSYSQFDVPDRITGRSGFEELKALNPSRTWNFVEINVTLQELQEMRQHRICYLVRPLSTVLDDSIGCAVWFASRGIGMLTSNNEMKPYNSTSKVVLTGIGADEQLGGYSRHRVRFNSLGYEGLVEELSLELDRIAYRNLGRDDRVIGDHGKEARFPFLDEDVVTFLNSLPVWEKTDLTLPRGIGEKLILRIAALELGLNLSSVLPKRAMQFGCRIAKMENCNEKASDTCTRLMAGSKE
ncbi:hypothetical protein XENTR_v10024314 [Xenopus tropicalis]|uniref:Asparagine synthetase domain-containing protein 1 n=1 Tax=Xenopus tropicalis TaxID=8364 RepID=F6RQV2_XENTR|nr:asparagine synthetase domain-containing protein 1 [Xenopus tropicalis]KAE8580122.1 hypothetical protein XENTR_v10024314 [Xenopus tropicalis]|eukprot:XP_002931571.1 PREDICTED: asparagine synthetase domain-containing protein 1 [Xenopus tropicalis]